MPTALDIRLRPARASDIEMLFGFQLDPASNEMAGTKPRDRETFFAHWDKVLVSSDVVARVIEADGAVVGTINIFKLGDLDAIGYWIAREHWGRGIAGRALALMLAESAIRPLHAQAAADNVASLRALRRNGFIEVSRGPEAATERFLAREVVKLVLE
ncbi:MAG: N-acetyltransferase [Leptolyngbya sp. PLA3]|nr:MAG: N-acetyltransferase [Cyanobacteria bacterium CYA]MCE7969135.1 N-acetyltransferase [Leptolyngbya sp. PL-A3]